MTTSVISQESTPIAKEINGHKYVLISPPQLKWANKQIAKVNFYEGVAVSYLAMTDSLKVEIEVFRELYAESLKQKEEQKANYQDLQKQMNMQEDHYEGVIKHWRKKVRNAIFIGVPIGMILGLLLSIFI